MWFILAISIFSADQISKIYIRNQYHLGQSKEIIGDYLRFTYLENKNAIFGLDLPLDYIFYPAAIISIIFIIYYLYQLPASYNLSILGLSLITGGALGNVIDRLRFQSVTDFIDMGINSSIRWYTYNLADAFILVGIFLIFTEDIFKTKKNKK